MPMFENTRKERDNLLKRRSDFLKEAEAEQAKGNTEAAKTAMDKAKALNGQIDDMNDMISEADRYANLHAPKFGTERQDMEEMGKMLAAGERVKISVVDTIAGLRENAGTLMSGPIATPQGGGSEIHDGFAGQVSSLIDMVNTVDLYGLGSWEEPYVVSDMEAQAGSVKTNSGKARTATDPVFAKAKLAAYEATTTSFIDRKISQLSPADYAARIKVMALRALRRKVNTLIVNGDGQAAPDMFGVQNAKNTDGNTIFANLADVTAIDENTLNSLVFGYGGDEAIGGNARLLLTKKSLKAFGALRGTNEKQRLYKITPDKGNPNIGTIEDGGMIVPYIISAAIGDGKLAYGDPINYMLALFGDYVIRADESVKSIERMLAILGDVTVGGNLTVDKGYSIATLAAAAQA